MKYKLVYTKRAVRDIQTLNSTIRMRIKESLEFFSSSPLNYAEKLTNSNTGTYRFRVGDYRIIFDIYKNEIIVLRVGHRREIYRKL